MRVGLFVVRLLYRFYVCDYHSTWVHYFPVSIFFAVFLLKKCKSK